MTNAEHMRNIGSIDGLERIVPMLATAVSLAFFGFVLTMVTDVIRRDGRKIRAALEGRSWDAQHAAVRRVTVRFSQPSKAVERVPVRTALRAAA